MKNEDIKDWLLREVMKIRAITDLFYVIDPHDIDRNTLAGVGCIIIETVEGIYENIKELL